MACGCQSNSVYPMELINIVKHNEETYSYDFVSGEPLDWFEGDSSKLILYINGESVSRKFSYASLPSENIARFTTRIRAEKSDFKERLSKLTVGEIVSVTEPSGEFVLRRDGRPALLLSNGVGIATMRSLIKAFSLDSSNVGRLTQINVDRSGALFKEEFDELSGPESQFTSVYVSNREAFYQKLDFESQKLMFGTGMIPNIYVVGSDEFIIEVSSHMESSGFSSRDIITDGPVRSLSGCGCSSGGGCGCA